jgi:hypothetical protein
MEASSVRLIQGASRSQSGGEFLDSKSKDRTRRKILPKETRFLRPRRALRSLARISSSTAVDPEEISERTIRELHVVPER